MVGDRVNHDRHGLGTVRSVDETGVTVDFGGGMLVRVDPRSAALAKL